MKEKDGEIFVTMGFDTFRHKPNANKINKKRKFKESRKELN